MALPIPIDPSLQGIIILIIFIIFVAVVYKLFKMAFSAGVAAAVGFSFPWIIEYLNLDLPITADLRTSVYFAAIAAGLYLAYEFSHYITAFFKIITWPVRSYFQEKQKGKVKKLEKEVKKIKKKKKR